jgi:hypothetical protein
MKMRRQGSSIARVALGFTLLLLSAFAARAQEVLWPTTGEWRVFETEHFRLHFPADSEEWARHAAARLEAIRDRVVAEVGYEPPQTIDVVVSDPVAQPNGSAWPFLGEPRMVLWTSPPGPESVLNHYADWTELLIVHEETHLVHLLRPSRNPIRQLLSRAVPAGPILFAPRWVSEGYATVVEGRLTGFGRPNGDLRASILRRRAQMGKLPTYRQMASDSSTYQGMSMAYLMGSAYLEWLEERAGPGSLRNLWARMTAREARSFGEAFEGVFGDSPEDLYGRFTAELTWRALEVERLRAPERKEGTLWQDYSWNTGGVAVSPDGQRLAVVLDYKDDPSKLVVLSTAPDEEAEKKAREVREKALARDPEDVAAVRARPLARKPLFILKTGDGVAPTTPRWMPDGKSILFVRFEPDLEGFSHPDLFLWTPETGEVRRLTHNANLREPDPSPDGRWAVAVRRVHGLSRLVRVDLATGETRDLTEPILTGTYEQPRISPDGTRIATVSHEEGRWRLVVLDAETGQPVGSRSGETAPPREATLAFPAWSRDGKTVYASVGERGFIDLYAFPADPGSGPMVPLTRTQGAAFSPEPLPDGSGLFYLSLEPDGLDLYRLDLPPAPTDAAAAASVAASPGSPAAELPAGLAPAVRPPAPAAQEPFEHTEVAADRPYGLGRQTYGLMAGGSLTSSGGVWELGLRGGDVLGRLHYLAFGSISGDGWPQGGALAVKYRGWPVTLGAHLFDAETRPSELSDVPPGLGRSLDLDRRGAELSAEWNPVWSGERLTAAARLYRGRVEPRAGGSLDQEIGHLGGGYSLLRQFGDWKLDGGAGLHYEAGRTDGDGWTRYGGQVRLGLGNGDSRLALTWRRDGSSDLRRSFDLYQLGGAGTSVLPETLLTSRIEVPALPEGTLRGDEHEGQRADLQLGFLPVPLFYERHRLWFDGSGKGEWQALAGFEGRFSIGPVPVVGLPELELRFGGARILDEPFKDDNRWWLITVWRP